MNKKYDFDYNELKGRIRAKFITQDKFAENLGVSHASLSAKLNGKTEFSHEEIAKAINLFGLKNDDIPKYFFVEKVQKN